MKIAIIGAGIAGNTAAYHLQRDHEITVFEAESYVGGHTHTHVVGHEGSTYQVDTGFIVFNNKTYPNFMNLLRELHVPWQHSHMSFSVHCEASGLEYNGTSLNALFAQRRNLLNPRFYRMIADILRFNKESLELLEEGPEIALGNYLRQKKYSQAFIDYYIIPMGAAIWSSNPSSMMEFPARFFVRFFHHHGMLSINDRPQWLVIQGGSRRYVEALTRHFRDRIRLNTPVAEVKRHADHVEVKTANGETEKFDWVVFACHSDQALRMLKDPTVAESDILGNIHYQNNSVILHHDRRLLPRKKLAWAAWNYHVTPEKDRPVAVTYNMNILQGLQSRQPLLVTLNHEHRIDPDKIIKRLGYTHPVYTPAVTAAQARHGEISGSNRTSYCGAYWRFGFHEDGVMSALTAVRQLQDRLARG